MTAMEVEDAAVVESTTDPLIVGLQLQPIQADGVQELLRQSRADGFDYVVTRLPTTTTTAHDPPPRRDVLQVREETWRTSVVGQILPASVDEVLSPSVWENALEWALHMSLPVVILPPLPIHVDDNDDKKDHHATTNTQTNLAAYARLVTWAAELMQRSGSCKLWIPLCPTKHLAYWRLLLQFCRYPSNVAMLVQLESYNNSNNNNASNSNNTGTTSTTNNSTAATAWLTRQLQLLHVTIGSGSIAAIQFHCHQFLSNKKGYPTLSKVQQTMLTYLLRRVGRHVKVLCAGPASLQSPNNPTSRQLPIQALGETHCLPHLQYLQHMRQRAAVRAVLDTTESRMEADYLDALQQPLQPLKDHLDNQTYIVFEKDPVKYKEYQRAIQMALQDRAAEYPSLVLAVVGAGRGPLVTAALQAYGALPAQQRPQEFMVWAVEKNPSAARRLQAMCRYEPTWQGMVQVVQADLRNLTAENLGGRPADIIVSELLGSLGCNELSPECLDGLWATNAVHNKTISIPASYTSHVAPVASIKLWQRARQQSLYPDRWETNVLGLTKAMETGYVARPYEASQMMAAQECWSFQHPRHGPASASPEASSPSSSNNNQYNNRSAVLDFKPDPKAGIAQGCGYGALELDVAKKPAGGDDLSSLTTSQAPEMSTVESAFSWTLTGLLGSFTTILYQRHEKEFAYLSTCPDRFSVGMFSWFPLYLPIETPVTVPTGAIVRVHLWRKVDPNNSVWYEWSIGVWNGSGDECLSMTPIHNPGGRSSKVSL